MKYNYDYSRLRGKIVTEFGTLSNFASIVGTSAAQVSRYFKGLSQFNQETILLWAESLHIDIEEIPMYFFMRK